MKHVVIGSLDPNPKVSGNGVEMMRARGIQIEVLQYAETNANLNQDSILQCLMVVRMLP